jgi:beta-lactamase class C
MAVGEIRLRGKALAIAGIVVFALVAWLTSGWRAAPEPIEQARLTATLDNPQRLRGLKIDYRRLDARIGALMQRKDMTGLSIAVVERGRLTFAKGYGTTAADGGEPVSPATVFRWASLSKGVASTLVAKMVADGRLDFVHSPAFYGSSLRLPDHGEERVTLIDILSHRLGLPKNAYDGRLESGRSPRAIRASLGDVAQLCPPGTCHSYQNIAFDAVSEIVARASGRSYAAMVRDTLFRPLGMPSASIGSAGLKAAADWARPSHSGRALDLAEAYYRVPAAAGVNSNIVDMARWMSAQMGEAPAILSPALLEVVHRPRVATARPYGGSPFGRALDHAAYGLAWRSFDFRGRRLVGHSGAVSGYRSTLIFDPQAKVGVAILWNSDSSIPFRLPGEVLDSYYGEPFTDFLGLDDDAPQKAPERTAARSEL